MSENQLIINLYIKVSCTYICVYIYICNKTWDEDPTLTFENRSSSFMF